MYKIEKEVEQVWAVFTHAKTYIESLFTGPDDIRKLAEQFKKQAPGVGEGAAGATAEDDDEVSELVPGEAFEATTEDGIKAWGWNYFRRDDCCVTLIFGYMVSMVLFS